MPATEPPRKVTVKIFSPKCNEEKERISAAYDCMIQARDFTKRLEREYDKYCCHVLERILWHRSIRSLLWYPVIPKTLVQRNPHYLESLLHHFHTSISERDKLRRDNLAAQLRYNYIHYQHSFSGDGPCKKIISCDCGLHYETTKGVDYIHQHVRDSDCILW
jgi:hypothetical protein